MMVNILGFKKFPPVLLRFYYGKMCHEHEYASNLKKIHTQNALYK